MVTHYTYAVIGAGIVGLATAYRLLARDPAATVVVLEAEDAVGRHQTGHNSGVIHSGIYYEPGSLKARFSRAGERATKDFCRQHGIAFAECGKLIVATTVVELDRMTNLERRAEINEIACRRIDPAELAELEPNVTGLGALHLPATGIVDYPHIARTLAESHARTLAEPDARTLAEPHARTLAPTFDGDQAERPWTDAASTDCTSGSDAAPVMEYRSPMLSLVSARVPADRRPRIAA